MEHYIYNIPLFLVNEVDASVDIQAFCSEVEEHLTPELLQNVEVVYIGDFKNLAQRNATYSNGAIYITSSEPTNFDMLENFIHETAHSLESQYGMMIYQDDLINEFKGKRERLKHLLEAEGFYITPRLYDFTEYNKKFDNFLANEVGYPHSYH